MDFNYKLKYMQDIINEYLNSIIPIEHQYIKTILDSMRYSLLSGGKRIRPVLTLGTGEIFGCPYDDLLPYGASIEMIHTYSLIHDDLPAMDNDDYRRGKLTNHKVFSEAISILAGDGLLNFAFENIIEYASKKNDMKYIIAALEIAHASGIWGMVGGQVVDIENEGKMIEKKTMDYMHANKTGAIINACVKTGAIIAGASENDITQLSYYAHDLGLAFQVIDDILDVIGDEKKMGKKTGSDIKKNKATYVSMYGIDEAKKIANQLSQSALSHIEYFGDDSIFLKQLTLYLLNRDY